MPFALLFVFGFCTRLALGLAFTGTLALLLGLAVALVRRTEDAFLRDETLRAASSLAMAEPSSAGECTVVTPAASRAANLSAAEPLPPAITAPAWPMRLPGGAVTPAM